MSVPSRRSPEAWLAAERRLIERDEWTLPRRAPRQKITGGLRCSRPTRTSGMTRP